MEGPTEREENQVGREGRPKLKGKKFKREEGKRKEEGNKKEKGKEGKGRKEIT